MEIHKLCKACKGKCQQFANVKIVTCDFMKKIKKAKRKKKKQH